MRLFSRKYCAPRIFNSDSNVLGCTLLLDVVQLLWLCRRPHRRGRPAEMIAKAT